MAKQSKPYPRVGDEYYIDTAFYLSHGRDDRVGGRVLIKKVEKEGDLIWLTLTEFPESPDGVLTRFGMSVGGPNGWGGKEWLKKQAELKKKFGNKRAHPDPDYDPESNEW